MEVEPTSPASAKRSRKRSSAWLSEGDDIGFIANRIAPLKVEDMPSKRMQNHRGEAVQQRQPLQYNAAKLLNNLAFTRFYVTANFQNYDPTSSFVILCMVSEQNELYRALCQILPSLYQVSPTLQALAITAGYVSPNSASDQSLLRILPLVTTACVEVTVVEEFAQFRREIGGPEGCIAVLNAYGTCVWSSSEAMGSEDDLQTLQRALTDVLTSSDDADVTMDD